MRPRPLTRRRCCLTDPSAPPSAPGLSTPTDAGAVDSGATASSPPPSDDLAGLHAACFTTPRPWSAAEIDDLLAQRFVFLVQAPSGFLLGRVIADEAELLTVAVAPGARRQGTGRHLLEEFAQTARTRGAGTAFLEVAEDNRAALALYAAAGWRESGRRRGYYLQPDGQRRDALVLTLTLAAPDS